jgi:hypothetical protein
MDGKNLGAYIKIKNSHQVALVGVPPKEDEISNAKEKMEEKEEKKKEEEEEEKRKEESDGKTEGKDEDLDDNGIPLSLSQSSANLLQILPPSPQITELLSLPVVPSDKKKKNEEGEEKKEEAVDGNDAKNTTDNNIGNSNDNDNNIGNSNDNDNNIGSSNDNDDNNNNSNNISVNNTNVNDTSVSSDRINSGSIDGNDGIDSSNNSDNINNDGISSNGNDSSSNNGDKTALIDTLCKQTSLLNFEENKKFSNQSNINNPTSSEMPLKSTTSPLVPIQPPPPLIHPPNKPTLTMTFHTYVASDSPPAKKYFNQPRSLCGSM